MGKQKELKPGEVSLSDIIEIFSCSKNPFLAVDTESGPNRGLLGISLSNDTHMTYLPVNHYDIDNLNLVQTAALKQVLKDKVPICHNTPYDIWKVLIPNHFLDRRPDEFYDTINMAHWVNENRISYDLDSVSRSLGGKPKNRSKAMQTMVNMENGWDDVPFEWMFEYSCNDAMITYDAFEILSREFIEQGFWGELWEYEQDFIEVMTEMVMYGIKVDLEFCIRNILKGQAIMRECLKELGYSNNLGPKNLADLFFKRLGFPVHKVTATGRPCFDKKEMEYYDSLLEQRNDPTAKTVLRFRGWQKTVGANYKAYLKYVDEEGVLHPGYKLHGTVTGRLSCSDPALQQIPRTTEQEWNGDLKKAFIPRAGKRLWDIDFSQLEFRLAAAYSEEPTLVEVFSSDRDIFTEMAAELAWSRYHTKHSTYAILYGGGAKRLADVYGITPEEGMARLKEFNSMYPELAKMRKRVSSLCVQRGWVKYWTGRRRHFEFPKNEGHKAFNSIIQGGAAEITKRAMIRIYKEVCDDHCKLVLQVHDSVVVEIDEGMEDQYLPRITKIMENPQFDFGVPFRVEVKEWAA